MKKSFKKMTSWWILRCNGLIFQKIKLGVFGQEFYNAKMLQNIPR